jgi:hypothetical protein
MPPAIAAATPAGLAFTGPGCIKVNIKNAIIRIQIKNIFFIMILLF